MAYGEGPGGQVHFDIQRVSLVGYQIFGVGSTIALRAVESRSSDLGDGAVGSYVGEAGEPVGLRGGRTCLKQGVGASEDGEVCFERGGIVGQAEGVDGALVGEQLSPPESGFYADARNVAELVDGGLGGVGREDVGFVEVERRVRYVPRGPANFAAPFSGHGF